jgi:hypothetical protein
MVLKRSASDKEIEVIAANTERSSYEVGGECVTDL